MEFAQLDFFRFGRFLQLKKCQQIALIKRIQPKRTVKVDCRCVCACDNKLLSDIGIFFKYCFHQRFSYSFALMVFQNEQILYQYSMFTISDASNKAYKIIIVKCTKRKQRMVPCAIQPFIIAEICSPPQRIIKMLCTFHIISR